VRTDRRVFLAALAALPVVGSLMARRDGSMCCLAGNPHEHFKYSVEKGQLVSRIVSCRQANKGCYPDWIYRVRQF